jgi:uncharacterized protein (DUF849 family)
MTQMPFADPFLMVAPTGARRTARDHPALPLSTADIVDTAVACHAAGADALHLHVRDAMGAHTLDAGRYLEALTALDAALPGLRVQITTEAADVLDVPAQLACLAAVKPRWASISVREIARSPELADRVYGTCGANGTTVQHILYDTADMAALRDWQAGGIVRADQTDMIFVLGRYAAGQMSAPADLEPFMQAVPDGAVWMACAFGQTEHQCLAEAERQGGALRVGFENNIHDAQGRPFADNAASVRALRELLRTAQTAGADPIDPTH